VSARPQPTSERFVRGASAFEAELDYVFRTLRRHGVKARDVEDLAQEVFLVMCRRWSDYDPGRSLRSWLAGIAVKIAQRYHSRGPREIPYDIVDRADESPGPDDQVASARVRALVFATLSKLPDHYRSILLMHELDGLSVREISNRLRLPVFTVHTRLRRARLRLAAAVQARDSAAALFPLGWVAAAVAVAATVAVVWPRTPPARPAAARSAPAAVATVGLTGRWTFDDAAGGVVRDLSGHGNDCVIHGPTATIPGVSGAAVDLGTQGWLECPQPAAAAGRLVEMTASVWINRAQRKAAGAIVTRHLGPGNENYFYLGYADDNLRVWSGSWTGWTTTQHQPTGTWTHVAFTHRGRTTRLYVDGKLAREIHDSTPRGSGTTASPLTIGAAAPWPNHHFDGAVDELLLYDRALSSDEIAALAGRRRAP
jgi:RNA polymerase sigma-70 factor, ECF subfamily